jgi:DNA-binding CsgD family transcriptional regulator
MDSVTLNNALKEIWHNKPQEYQLVREEIDLEIQKKILSVFNEGDFYYYIFNLPDRTFEYISPNVERIIGISPVNLTVESFLSRVHPDDQQMIVYFEDTVLNFFKKLPPEKYFSYKIRYDFRVQKTNNEYARLLQQIIIINYNPDGSILHAFGLHSDITHLKTDNHPNLSFIGLHGEPSYLDHPIENFSHPRHPTIFSTREHEILNELWEGLDSLEIANKLHISKNTVDTHRRTMLKKAGARNLVELIRFGLKNGEL